MNVLPAIGVYAAIRREKGEAFSFPGGPPFVWEAADADLVGQVMVWAALAPLPTDLPVPMKLAAEGSHYALYALMIGMPLLGWGMLSAAEYPIVLYGGWHLPQILPQSDFLHTLLWDGHFYLAFAFFALILMHVAAALFHALVRHDGVFEAMASVSPSDEVAPAE